MSTKNTSIRLDPKIKGLLDRIPEGFDKDFTDEQLIGLNIALGKRSWRDHPIDFRHIPITLEDAVFFNRHPRMLLAGIYLKR